MIILGLRERSPNAHLEPPLTSTPNSKSQSNIYVITYVYCVSIYLMYKMKIKNVIINIKKFQY